MLILPVRYTDGANFESQYLVIHPHSHKVSFLFSSTLHKSSFIHMVFE